MALETPSEIQEKAIPVYDQKRNHFIGITQQEQEKTAVLWFCP